MRRVGALPLSSEVLVQVLGLPVDTRIYGARFDVWRNLVELLVEHPDIPESYEACAAPTVLAVFKSVHDAVEFDRWEVR